MIGEPWFWRDDSIAAKAVRTALAPFAWTYEVAGDARQRFAKPWRASVPVICIGNAAIGGVGKTPFALMLGRMLQEKGFKPHFLSRGYGGEHKGPALVDPDAHTAHDVGDEPLLLARQAPTWVSRNKRAGAQAAIAKGAEIIVMDDGFQNPTIEKDFSILLTDERHRTTGLKIFPAGPMRESMDAATARADAVIEIKTSSDAPQLVPAAEYAAWLEAGDVGDAGRVLAFCGIANPQRFFETLDRAGFDIADAVAFPDHYPYTRKNIGVLMKQAKTLDADLITTEKDWVRIHNDHRAAVRTLPVRMRVSDPDALIASIIESLNERGNG